MDRRAFLRTTGLAMGAFGAGHLLAACGDGPAIPEGAPTLNLISASFPEVLTGDRRRFAFGLTTIENVPVEETGVQVYTRVPGSDEPAGGPYDTEFFAEGPLGMGVYLSHIDAPEPGYLEVVAVSGRDHGAAAVNVVRPEDSQAPVPGSEAVATKTPTFDDTMGFEEICTREPDCPLHERSLDDLLGDGRPLMVMFATPAYCQTAVCGPAVDTFVDLAEDRDWGDLGFLHVEIFTDAGVTVAGPVRDWGLPSEPWLFAVDANGVIVERVDGPMIPEELIRIAEQVA